MLLLRLRLLGAGFFLVLELIGDCRAGEAGLLPAALYAPAVGPVWA